MKFEITLSEDDYLNQSLFIASKSKLVRKRRITTLIILFGAFALMSLSCFLSDTPFMPWWYVLIIGVIFVFLYTFYQRNLYQRHYRKSIADTYKNRFGKSAQIEFRDNQLLTMDYVGEGKLNLNQLEHIYETGDYFFLKFKTAEVLILPKKQIPNVEDFRVIITELIQKHDLPFDQEPHWKFK